MPYDPHDPALSAVGKRLNQGMHPSDAYYEVFQPRRNSTIERKDYYEGMFPAIVNLTGPFSQIQVQLGSNFKTITDVSEAFVDWMGKGMAFLHIHKSEDSRYRVYIAADLRHVGNIVRVLWNTASLTGFKIVGYDDADNRSDVMVVWVKTMSAVQSIGHRVPSAWLHGMRPPGSTMIRMGCQIGYSDEVTGSSMGTEITNDLRSGRLAT